MSSLIEFEGKNVEKALQKAGEKLKTPIEKIKYDVISYGSTGIFGLVGTKKARIRIIQAKGANKTSQESRKKNTEREKKTVVHEKSDEIIIKETENKNGIIKIENAENIEFNETETENENLISKNSVVIEKGKNILQKIIDLITDEAKINVNIQGKNVFFDITGGNPGMLIGKKGQTLEAIQYLVEKIINKMSEERIQLQVDVENYLKSRRTNLENLSSRLAEKAKRIGKPLTIGHMNAQDRRIVHMHLKDESGIRTQSVGDGYYRKLVIFPRKAKK